MSNTFKYIEDFMEFATERYKILLRRQRGEPWPWTEDGWLQEFYFCNVFREDDKTTIWFRENIREPLQDDPKVLMATVAFRWFNRITTGERIKGVLCEAGWNGPAVRSLLQGVSPLVTGAFMVKSPPGINKLDGLCNCIEAVAKNKENLLKSIRAEPTLEFAWSQLLQYPYLGNFMAYEVVTDLRHTFLLRGATDINTWASPGPGCARGLSRLIYGNPNKLQYMSKKDRARMMECLQLLIVLVWNHWPKQWPRWEMREVEHVLCEYDKYKRAQEKSCGQKVRMKRKYQPPQ